MRIFYVRLLPFLIIKNVKIVYPGFDADYFAADFPKTLPGRPRGELCPGDHAAGTLAVDSRRSL